MRVTATCDPRVNDLTSTATELEFGNRGIRTYSSYEEMISRHTGELDLITVAAPIPLHAAIHQACVDASLPCYLEKPPTLDPREFEAMLACEARAAHATQVGFHYIYLKDRLELKRRIVAGEFGGLRAASFLGLSRRSPAYYGRSSWAGRLLLGDQLVLDSCFGNAFAHQVNNMLFFAGTLGVDHWAAPIEVESRLFRANDIQGADTVFATTRLDTGCELRLAITHATTEQNRSVERLEFANATIEIEEGHRVFIHRPKGDREEFPMEKPSLESSFLSYLAYLRRDEPRPAMSLENSRSFVDLNALIYLASGTIETPPSQLVEDSSDHSFGKVLPGIEKIGADFAGRTSALPSLLAKNSPAARSAVPSDIPGLRKVITRMAAELSSSVS